MKRNLIVKIGLLFSTVILLILAGCQEAVKEHEKAKKEMVETLGELEKTDEKKGKKDMGKKPWAFDIEKATIENDNYRKVEWTGKYMQLVLMSLKPGEVIDLEVHHDHDQFIRIDEGEGKVMMGKEKDNLTFEEAVSDDWAILIPAGYWHTVKNTGEVDLKLYSIYAPAEHAAGLVHKTYEDTEGYEH